MYFLWWYNVLIRNNNLVRANHVPDAKKVKRKETLHYIQEYINFEIKLSDIISNFNYLYRSRTKVGEV